MVFGLLSAVAAVPAIIGTTEAVKQGQRANAREQHRGRKSNMIVTLPMRNKYSQKFDNALIVLKDDKLFVDTARSHLGALHGHPFTGYFLPYPGIESRWKKAGFKGEGMVSTITDDPPMLNWIYIDKETHEVKYGIRAVAEQHLTGPWDVTEIDKRVTFEGWEGFAIVEEDEEKDLWGLYFDRDDDGFRRVGARGKKSLEVEVWRKERRRTKEMEEEERAERLQRRREKEAKEQEEQNEDTSESMAKTSTTHHSYDEEIDD